MFGHLAYLADKDIMRPYRLNETLLDDQLRSRVFIIHNVLAQVQGSPSEATLKNFRSWKLEFYEEISYIRTLLQPEELLYRKGILSRPFDTPIGGSP